MLQMQAADVGALPSLSEAGEQSSASQQQQQHQQKLTETKQQVSLGHLASSCPHLAALFAAAADPPPAVTSCGDRPAGEGRREGSSRLVDASAFQAARVDAAAAKASSPPPLLQQLGAEGDGAVVVNTRIRSALGTSLASSGVVGSFVHHVNPLFDVEQGQKADGLSAAHAGQEDRE